MADTTFKDKTISSFEYSTIPMKLPGNSICSVRTNSSQHITDIGQYDAPKLLNSTSSYISIFIGEEDDNHEIGITWEMRHDERGQQQSSDPLLILGDRRLRIALCESNIQKTVDSIFPDTFQKAANKYHAMAPEEQSKALQNVSGVLIYNRDDASAIKISGEDIAHTLDNSKELDMGTITGPESLKESVPLPSSGKLNVADSEMKNPSESAMLRMGLWTHASIALLGSQIFDQPVLDVLKRVEDISRTPNFLTFLKSKGTGTEGHKNFVKAYHSQIMCK